MKDYKQDYKMSLGFFLFGLVAVVIGFLSFLLEVPVLSLILIILGGIFCVVGIGTFKSTIEEKRKDEEQDRLFRENKWKFPADEFYLTCKKTNITNLKDEYSIKKASLIAQDILKKYSVPQDCFALYVDNEKIIRYFNEQSEAEKKQAELDYITPQKANIEKNQLYKINFRERIKGYYGTEKRVGILSPEVDKLKTRLASKKKLADSSLDMAIAVKTSTNQVPKKDWALLGGIADGIAGPAAGLAVANQAMQDNMMAEQQKATNKAYADTLAKDIIENSFKISGDISRLEIELEEKESILQQAKYKIVFDEVSQKDIFDSMTFSTTIISSENELKFKVTIKNNYSTKIAPDIKKVIDGTLQAKIYCDNILVDDVCIDLPTMGLDLNGDYSDVFVSRKYMIGENRNYHFEFAPNKLWLMEC